MHLTPATAAHLAHVRAHLRPSALRDLQDANGPDADCGAAFDFAVQVSRVVYAFITESGECVGIGAACDEPFHDAAGMPWFMGTPGMHAEERGVLRASRALIGYFYDAHPWKMLATYISSNNPVSLRWLTRWLGFVHEGDIGNYARATIPFHVVVHHPTAATCRYDRTLFHPGI